MLLNDVFERFAQDSPVPVMVRALLENTRSQQSVDYFFENVDERQYTRTLLFSLVVDVMGLVVTRLHTGVNAAFLALAETIGDGDQVGRQQTRQPRTDPLGRVRRHHCRTDGDDRHDDGRRPAPAASGLPIRILDGNHLAATEHRIKEFARCAPEPCRVSSLCTALA